MRTFVAAVVVCALAPGTIAQDPPRLVSPEVRPDRTVVFRFWAPKADAVQLIGNWLVGQLLPQMTKAEDGIWTFTSAPLEPNIYGYAFLVDGVRAADPSCRCIVPWAGRGADSTFTIPGAPAKPWERQNQPPGTLHHEQFLSKRQQIMRRFLVYTPPGYDTSRSRRYPLLVLLTGTPGDELSWTSGGGFADVIFDNLIAEGRMVPTVVVMHASDVLDPPDERRGDENLHAFETILVNELLPAVRQRYRVSTDPNLSAIVGLSLGGEFGMYAGLKHPELFRTVASISGSLVDNSFKSRFAPALADPSRVKRQFRLIWLGIGSDDVFIAGNRAFAARLDAAKIPHVFRPTPGPHSLPVAREALVELLPLLFR